MVARRELSEIVVKEGDYTSRKHGVNHSRAEVVLGLNVDEVGVILHKGEEKRSRLSATDSSLRKRICGCSCFTLRISLRRVTTSSDEDGRVGITMELYTKCVVGEEEINNVGFQKHY